MRFDTLCKLLDDCYIGGSLRALIKEGHTGDRQWLRDEYCDDDDDSNEDYDDLGKYVMTTFL